MMKRFYAVLWVLLALMQACAPEDNGNDLDTPDTSLTGTYVLDKKATIEYDASGKVIDEIVDRTFKGSLSVKGGATHVIKYTGGGKTLDASGTIDAASKTFIINLPTERLYWAYYRKDNNLVLVIDDAKFFKDVLYFRKN
ncbi:hypothetical protein ACL9RF_15805 [Sphingobacterium sp. Mn56C]|uniref:hypothetical protein n=1 Tax=Sphingobacterium sp. Mn56C TaxID=3395261 RepID=UPI003BC88198